MKKFGIVLVIIIFVLFLSYLFLIRNPNIQNNISVDTGNKLSVNIQPEDQTMKITSSAFENNTDIPSKYTCDGNNFNPPISISNVPEKAKSLTLIMDDPNAPMGTWTHWVLWNIDPKTNIIEENNVPPSALNSSLPKESKAFMAANQGNTSFGKPGYGGPCPPSGTHRYFFKLYALDTILSISPQSKKEDLEKAFGGHILDKTELVGLYSRN